VLDTWVINVSVQRFYERHGFTKKRIMPELVDRFQRLGPTGSRVWP